MTGYAERVRWSPHRIDLSRAMFGVALTPLHDVVAPTLERLPADIGAQLRRDFWKQHDASGDWDAKHAAQNWLATEVAEFEREKVHRAFDECEVRALASRWSDLCLRMVRLEPMQDFARSVGIEPPVEKGKVTRVGAAARMACPRWWRRQIRKHYTRRAESHLRASEFVHKRRQVYASDRAVESRRQRKVRDKAMLQEMVAVSDAGDQLNLFDVVEKSQANPAIRRAELMVRLRGFEEVAQAAGHVAEFVTLTCPSAFHRMHVNGTQNEKWEGFTPRQGQQWLCKMWARARAKLKRLSVFFYGFRIAEPHHDGTPHWHMVLFSATHAASALCEVLRGVWLSEYGAEAGAGQRRSVFKRIDPAKGSAAGYLAKYVAKNIDGFGVGDDYETNGQKAAESCDRVGAWASAHGVRQFQQIGGPAVTVWRELRRLREAGVHPAIRTAHAAADAGQWSEFIAALGGIERGRNGNVKLWTEHTGELNQYGELRGPQIAGVECVSSSLAQASGVDAGCLSGLSFDGMQASKRARRSRDLNSVSRSACAIERIRTRTKVWRIERKKRCTGSFSSSMSANDATRGPSQAQHIGASGGAIRSAFQRKTPEGGKPGSWDSEMRSAGVAPAPVSPLGPVSITVRGSKTMPGESSTGARGSGSIRGPTWTH